MSDALHVLVFVVILLVFFGVWRSVLNRGMGRAAGWAFAGWTAGQPHDGATDEEGAINIALQEEARGESGAIEA